MDQELGAVVENSLSDPNSGLPNESDDPATTATPFRFLDLPPEMQSHVVDFLDFVTIKRLKGTCHALQALPMRTQEFAALEKYEDDAMEAYEAAREEDQGPWGRGNIYGGPYGAAWAEERALPQKFPCYECLRVKDITKFDVSRFEEGYWNYMDCRKHSPLPKVDDIWTGDRLCFDCIVGSEDALANGTGPGWLKLARLEASGCFKADFDYHIRCSQCLEIDKIELPFSTDYEYGSDCTQFDSDYATVTEVRKHPDSMICHRMLDGDLCQACFKEDNVDWFELREQLRAEIAVRSQYLSWMIHKDDEGGIESPPGSPPATWE